MEQKVRTAAGAAEAMAAEARAMMKSMTQDRTLANQEANHLKVLMVASFGAALLATGAAVAMAVEERAALRADHHAVCFHDAAVLPSALLE